MFDNLSPIVRAFAVTTALFAAAATAPCQMPAAQTPAANDPDSEIVTKPVGPPKTPAQLKDQAWSMLKAGVLDTKHPQTQTQALAALGTMGSNGRSLGMIRAAMDDKDVDVRVAAALAAGQTRSRDLTTDLRRLLDDKEPTVAFIAALTLWKMHDRSGEDILTAVADGERKTVPGLVHGAEHDIDRQLHDPEGIARFGALQGASMLLGPFGFGITAYEYIHKNGGDSARVTAIEAIAQNHTVPIRKELIDATLDNDLGVRAAACKALARYHDPAVAAAIAKVFDDGKPPVRLTAAASYLVSTGVAPGSPVEGETALHAARP
jgi:HEAT repeat protein